MGRIDCLPLHVLVNFLYVNKSANTHKHTQTHTQTHTHTHIQARVVTNNPTLCDAVHGICVLTDR